MKHTNENRLEFVVDDRYEGKELKEILYGEMRLSSRLVRRLKRNQGILVNGNRITFHARLRKGDKVEVVMADEANQFEPENIPIAVVYEDIDLLIVNKQPGLVVHPTKGHPTGTMANALVYRMKYTGENFKIRFVNRLDRDTSGLVVIAKNPYAQQELSKQMQKNQVEKIYLAVAKGTMEEDHGTIDAPIGRPDPEDIMRKVYEGGQPSVTHYEVVRRLKDATVVRIKLETGRTHQIRVHMAHIGHPLIGDELYGYTDKELIGRQALHAGQLIFNQPRTKERIEVRAPIPQDIKTLIQKLS
ncbi:RluA family pseudouridine synthase [Thermotalea metallivorans]|uniref:Pseudouridine synthase n=1 Tax=Thermotalea metallivorans TaxID=520762 RepID=A0A140KZ60_9FIRM|nr:RluA family pseudouridine synthase [Thermotalea metallivorans]KXG73585.1 Ribosomal large subunit pseudouridine synthase D [Thermotalea metallivorans]